MRWRADADKLVHVRQMVRVTFPPILYGWLLPRGIVWFIRVVSRFTARFIWQVFIRIHSEMRLLCMADAALGAAVGYFAGSAIIGALAGGVFGLVNYAVVTKRVLEPRGLLPARQSSLADATVGAVRFPEPFCGFGDFFNIICG